MKKLLILVLIAICLTSCNKSKRKRQPSYNNTEGYREALEVLNYCRLNESKIVGTSQSDVDWMMIYPDILVDNYQTYQATLRSIKAKVNIALDYKKLRKGLRDDPYSYQWSEYEYMGANIKSCDSIYYDNMNNKYKDILARAEQIRKYCMLSFPSINDLVHVSNCTIFAKEYSKSVTLDPKYQKEFDIPRGKLHKEIAYLESNSNKIYDYQEQIFQIKQQIEILNIAEIIFKYLKHIYPQSYFKVWCENQYIFNYGYSLHEKCLKHKKPTDRSSSKLTTISL